ncbi:unnamed protein product [Zymoseptoria tritici ST99CH_3D1]|nr:unnamed protein product [Zymoseptoria tritici ST99CH_3D1]
MSGMENIKMASPGYEHEDAYDSGMLPVGSLHQIYFEQYGKKDGKPVIFLHGGPGGSTSKENTAFFDPAVYRVVLMDQRGAGKSKPHAEVEENTSQHLVSDIEALRSHLDISKWHMVFGGSWGSTLALLYAQTHPEAVGSLVLRGIFLGRKIEFDWSFGRSGVAMLYPDAHEKLISHIPEEERKGKLAEDLPRAYFSRFTSSEVSVRRAAGKVWNAYELRLSKVDVPASDLEKVEDDDWSLSHGIMESHYFMNGLFVRDGQLLEKENVDRMREIPGTIVQGRLDLVCPPRSAWDLHRAWPEAAMHMIPAAGHSVKEPGIFKKLVEICDEYGKHDFS